jgi:hypothetical protein
MDECSLLLEFSRAGAVLQTGRGRVVSLGQTHFPKGYSPKSSQRRAQ